MIKSLLAYTTSEQDALGAAETTWNALLQKIGEGMPTASSFRRDDLPEILRNRHSTVSDTEQQVLRALRDHSELIVNGIRSSIGANNLHLSRVSAVQQVLHQMESTQVVLITGLAGSGKSGIAKDAIEILTADHFVFSFRAEEFAVPHLDEVFRNSRIPASATELGTVLAGQGRKVLLVESVERLLEKSTRDAFFDLLTLVAKDKSWRLLLTCRDYSSDLVRTSFLEARSIGHSSVVVPPLSDEELEETKTSYPILELPFTNASLRRLLSNPYFLDMALRIQWSAERPLPQSERDLRLRFWQDIVRNDSANVGGMPRRREEAFLQIALQCARALNMYAPCGDLDPAVIEAFRRDSLILSPQGNETLVAAAHDVLEDWAIIQWIDRQHALHNGSVKELSAALGTCPAIRRTYRKWLTELLESNPDAADLLFESVLKEAEITAQFRDDTLVSLLRSDASPVFLERHAAELFQDNKALLTRVIHLVRVACVTTPSWLRTVSSNSFLFNIPDGPAWACVLTLVRNHLGEFTPQEYLLLLGFIDDWGQSVSWHTPYPAGAEAVAAIGHWLLHRFDDYRSDDERHAGIETACQDSQC